MSEPMTIKELRKAIRSDPATCGMLMPCTKAEIFLDLNNDGKADFAFIDSEGNGKGDTFAVDMTGNGEFNLYFKDTDYNGIGDDVRYYMDGQDDPVFISTGERVEAAINDYAVKFLNAISGDFDGASFVQTLKAEKVALAAAVAKRTPNV